MSARVLVLTAGFGEGHNAAARALTEACDAAGGNGTARMVDVFALAAPRLNAVARRGYLELITRAPGLWNSVYRWLDRSPRSEKITWFLRGEIRELAAVIDKEQPAVLCSTYPIYAFMLRELARTGRASLPHFNVVTDSISINSLWWRAGSTGWFVPNEDSAEVMARAGVEASKLHVLGFPVSAFFEQHRTRSGQETVVRRQGTVGGTLAPPDLAAGRTPRVLCVVNSGTHAAVETARRLLTDSKWDVTCTVGRNDELRTELMRLAVGRRYPSQILGWTDQIPRLLMTHNVVISKAGGATTQEALAARCPMIVNQIVPGQEEGNYELLRRHGIGALAETPAAVLAVLDQAFANQGALWCQWRRALVPLSRPDAAAEIAHFVLTGISGSGIEPMRSFRRGRSEREADDGVLPSRAAMKTPA